MADFIFSLSLLQLTIVILGIAMAVGLGLSVGIRLLFRLNPTDQEADLAIDLMQIASTYIGILLAFAGVLAWQDYKDAENAIQQEASTASEVYRDLTIYGEGQAAANLCGRVFRRYDGAGYTENTSYDFKGNLLKQARQLASEYKESPDWSPLAGLTDGAALDSAAAGRPASAIFPNSRLVYDIRASTATSAIQTTKAPTTKMLRACRRRRRARTACHRARRFRARS